MYNEETKKQNAKEIIIDGDIIEIINTLMEYDNKNETVFTMFNGYKIYSCDLGMSAYKAFFDYSEKLKKELKDELNKPRSKQEVRDSIPEDDQYKDVKMNASPYGNKPNIWIPLDKVIELLEDVRDKENVYYDFDGHKIYSCDLTIDGAYKQVYGVTKQEYDQIGEEIEKVEENTFNEQEKAAIALIPYWIKQLKDVVDPRKLEEWSNYIQTTYVEYLEVFSNYPIAIGESIRIIKDLESGISLEDANKMFKQSSFTEPGIIKYLVKTFSKRGPEFSEYVTGKTDSGITPASIEKATRYTPLSNVNKAMTDVMNAAEEQEHEQNKDGKTQADE